MRTVAALVTLPALALLAGCGSSTHQAGPAPTVTTTVTTTATPATGTSPSPASAPATPAGPQACATADLTVSLGPANGAAGSSYVPLRFTNAGTQPCTLFGFPGVSYVTGAAGTQVGAAAARGTASPATVTVAVGATASALLQVVDPGNYGCAEVAVTGLRVYPPGNTAAAFVPLPGKACPTQVAQLTVGGVVSGDTGTTP